MMSIGGERELLSVSQKLAQLLCGNLMLLLIVSLSNGGIHNVKWCCL